MARSGQASFIRLAIVCFLVSLPAAVLTQNPPPPPVPPPPPPPTRIDMFRFVMGPPSPRTLTDDAMRVPPDNPMTEAKAALGRTLFFDPVLSADGKVSCATCHDPKRGFADPRPIAVGVFGRVGKRHSPALVNRGFGRMQFWDGRADTLEGQVLQPIADANEMGNTIAAAVARLTADKTYRAAFASVFDDGVNADNLARALSSFVRTIKSVDTPYDRFLAGDKTALSADAQAGLEVFRRRGRCAVCHSEPALTDEWFHNTGVAWKGDGAGGGSFVDEGRSAVSNAPRDRGSFKTPTLREIGRTSPYMHDGSLETLAAVVEFYDAGGRPNLNRSRVLRPLGLTAEEKRVLIAFLESLSSADFPRK